MRRLVAILAADIVGFSRQMAIDEERVLARQDALHKNLIDPEINRYGGRIFKMTGDGFLAEFSSIVDALRAAVSIQLALTPVQGNANNESPNLVYRMGINLGDVVAKDGDIHGNGVNVAVRLEGLAQPGGICVSRTVENHVKGKIASDFTSLGIQNLKNIPEPIQVFRVEMHPEERVDPIPGTKSWTPRSLVIGTVLAACVVAVIAWAVPWQSNMISGSQIQTPESANFKPTVTVLPFTNLSGDQDQDYFADGVTDDLINDLSRLSGLFVIARSSSFFYKDKTQDVSAIARELGVRYVLEGSIKRAGDKIRLNTQLIDSQTNAQVWAERYDHREENLFTIQNQIVSEIAKVLSVQLTNQETQRLEHQPTRNLEAYDYYLRAENLGRGWDASDGQGLNLYQKATDLDPTFANAFTGYARIAVNLWNFELNDVMPGGLARKHAYDAITKAVELDNRNSRAFAVLSRLQLLDGYADLAIASAEKSVSLAPNGDEAYVALANAYVVAGRHTEALTNIEEAASRNPNPSPRMLAELGWILFHNRRYEEAISKLEAAERGGVSYLQALTMAYAQANQLKKARKTVGRILASAKRANVQLSRLRFAHFAKQEDLHHMVEALRTAGLPEWPLNFKAPMVQRLSHDDLKQIAAGRAWQGSNLNVSPQFFQQNQSNGKYAYRDNQAILTGEYSIDGDQLCQLSVNYVMGRRQCGYVYRNPKGMLETLNQYTYVNTNSVLMFSVVE